MNAILWCGVIDGVESDIVKAKIEYWHGRDISEYVKSAKARIESLAQDDNCKRLYWRLENELQSFLAEVMKHEVELQAVRIEVVEVVLPQPTIHVRTVG